MSDNIYPFPVIASQDEIDRDAEARAILADMRLAYKVLQSSLWLSLIVALMLIVQGALMAAQAQTVSDTTIGNVTRCR